jgi:hypothetical protein
MRVRVLCALWMLWVGCGQGEVLRSSPNVEADAALEIQPTVDIVPTHEPRAIDEPERQAAISCDSDGDCYQFHHSYECLDGVCVDMSCETAQDCPNQWPCRSGGCLRSHTPCRSLFDCPRATECWPDGRCVPMLFPPCKHQRDCYPNYTCVLEFPGNPEGRCYPNNGLPPDASP